MREALQLMWQEEFHKGAPLADVFQLPDPTAQVAKKKKWLYLGPCCSDRPSSKALSMVEVYSRIHKVLDLGVNLNPRASPAPLQEGVTSARVTTLGPISVAYAILSFHYAHGLTQGLGGGP
jgi:hypothetical protein